MTIFHAQMFLRMRKFLSSCLDIVVKLLEHTKDPLCTTDEVLATPVRTNQPGGPRCCHEKPMLVSKSNFLNQISRSKPYFLLLLLLLPATAFCQADKKSSGNEAATKALLLQMDKLSEKIDPKVIAWRRDIHQHPELSNREFKTAEKVAAHLCVHLAWK